MAYASFLKLYNDYKTSEFYKGERAKDKTQKVNIQNMDIEETIRK